MTTRQFPFALVDAFTAQPLTGNPCAVVMEADKLSDAEMLAVAKEMNQSETAFLLRSSTSDLRARFFTPEREIPLAGHPTIASIHVALENGLIKNSSGREITMELNEGPIRIKVENAERGRLIRMSQRKPVFGEIHDPREVLALFGLGPSDLFADAPIQTVSTGSRQLMVLLKNHEALRRISMNVPAYREYRERMDFFSAHFFCLGGISAEASTFARHPGIPPQTPEDAFTGSSTGGMAAYLFKYGYLRQSHFIAEQGHWMGRPGRAFVDLIGQPHEIESVVVSGEAVTTVRGTLQL